MASETKNTPSKHVRRAPTNSFWYDKLMPVVFILLALVMLAVIGLALGILVGVVRY